MNVTPVQDKMNFGFNKINIVTEGNHLLSLRNVEILNKATKKEIFKPFATQEYAGYNLTITQDYLSRVNFLITKTKNISEKISSVFQSKSLGMGRSHINTNDFSEEKIPVMIKKAMSELQNGQARVPNKRKIALIMPKNKVDALV